MVAFAKDYAPEIEAPDAQNRVWEFFLATPETRRVDRRPARHPRREKPDTFTKTASGMSYYGFRFYSPGQGRFLNRDPIEEQGGLNLYAFVGNDPVNYIDYLGLNPLNAAVFRYFQRAVPYRITKELGWNSLLLDLLSVAHIPNVRHVRSGNPRFRVIFGRQSVLLPPGTRDDQILHELVHVYNHNRGGPTSARRDEGMAYVTQWSAGNIGGGTSPVERLIEIEIEIGNFRIENFGSWYNGLRSQWNQLWGFWGSLNSYEVTGFGFADATDIGNVEGHLGFRLSCSQAAATFNDMVPFSCIRFVCDDGRNLSGTGILTIDTNANIDPAFQ